MANNRAMPTMEAEETYASIMAKIDDKTRLLRLPEVESIIGLKKTNIYDMIKHDRFPKPIRLGPKSVAWLNTDIQAWIARQALTSLTPMISPVND